MAESTIITNSGTLERMLNEETIEPGNIITYRTNVAVEELLGTGGMGRVYKGTMVESGRPVAIKVTRTSNAELSRRLLRELKICSQLNHENIAEMLHFGEVIGIGGVGFYYAVFEFIEGMDLERFMCLHRLKPAAEGNETKNQYQHLLEIHQNRTGVCLPNSVVAYIGWALAQGLGYAHERDIIHRDIDGYNVMISKEGVVKLLDFGIAASPSEIITELRRGEISGKIRTFTPESLQPSYFTGKFDHRADLYQLGLLLYELSTGLNPNLDYRLEERINQVSDPIKRRAYLRVLAEETSKSHQKKLVSADEIVPSVHPQLSTIISKCLNFNPQDRYQKASDFREAIRGFLLTPGFGITPEELRDYIEIMQGTEVTGHSGEYGLMSLVGRLNSPVRNGHQKATPNLAQRIRNYISRKPKNEQELLPRRDVAIPYQLSEELAIPYLKNGINPCRA